MHTLQRVSYVETETLEVPGAAYAEANVEDIGPCGVRFREVGSGRKGDNTIKVSRGGLRPNPLIMSGCNSWSFSPTLQLARAAPRSLRLMTYAPFVFETSCLAGGSGKGNQPM